MFFLKKLNRNVFSAILIFASLFVASLALSCDNAADDSTKIFLIAAKKKEIARQEAERKAMEEAQAEEQARASQAQAQDSRQAGVVIFRGTTNVQRVSGAGPKEIAALAALLEGASDPALDGSISMSLFQT